MKKLISKIKTNLKDRIRIVKERIKEIKERSKDKSISPLKSSALGMATVLSIFGITLLFPMLPAVAKDLSKKPATSGGGPTSAPTNSPADVKEAQRLLAGAASSICAGAVFTGSFAVGAACGVVVVLGIVLTRNAT